MDEHRCKGCKTNLMVPPPEKNDLLVWAYDYFCKACYDRQKLIVNSTKAPNDTRYCLSCHIFKVREEGEILCHDCRKKHSIIWEEDVKPPKPKKTPTPATKCANCTSPLHVKNEVPPEAEAWKKSGSKLCKTCYRSKYLIQSLTPRTIWNGNCYCCGKFLSETQVTLCLQCLAFHHRYVWSVVENLRKPIPIPENKPMSTTRRNSNPEPPNRQAFAYHTGAIAAASAPRAGSARIDEIRRTLRENVIGQTDSIDSILPHIVTFEAGLTETNRPAGIFLLLGPSGTGKTRTTEVLSEALHGSETSVLRIDCAEYQLEHEVAKLIGAPPGYLGHRETQPLITQGRLNALASDKSRIGIVLFDEIEKAAASLHRMLLGIMDRAVLRLGDNNVVSFQNVLIFMTSNLGVAAMEKFLRPSIGFAGAPPPVDVMENKLREIGLAAVRRKFSPEFVNRIDEICVYRPLTRETSEKILELQLDKMRTRLVVNRGIYAPRLRLTPRAKSWLLDKGFSTAYGARELKRVIARHITQPLARLLLDHPREVIDVRITTKDDALVLSIVPPEAEGVHHGILGGFPPA